MVALDALTIYVGYDPREYDAYEVCAYSIHVNATDDVKVKPLALEPLKHAGLYTRQHRYDGDRMIDCLDGLPFSTEFAFSRFLVPALEQYEGVALFVDCDFLFRGDVNRIMDEFDPRYAVQVVKHDYRPKDAVKMDNQVQQLYSRKNWSSCILWNCGHPANLWLTPERVNNEPGRWLHNFGWLVDNDIGGLDERWNWLEGHSTSADPVAVHFTRGGPWFAQPPGEYEKWSDVPYAEEWRAAAAKVSAGS